jgi:trans-2,3-dihydro-3-hydroxyanthranilate isomerase
MSRKIKFFILDVFGTKNYSGNQLAVFIDEEGITSEEMQQIAREINFSETTFINPKANVDGSFNVRIFTPVSEVNFAGHPTLGSAYIIADKLLYNLQANIMLHLKVGNIMVNAQGNTFYIKQIEPQFGKIYNTDVIAEMLQIDNSEIVDKYKIEEVSTGLPFTIVPLNNMNALKRCKIDQHYYNLFIEQAWAKGILVFCPEGYDKNHALAVRVFVNYLGIPEDPATGSANGCLAAYLLKHKYFSQNEINITVGQGYEIKRDSELYLRAALKDNKYNIEVGGKTTMVAEGFWE